jgi:hypothetical protein
VDDRAIWYDILGVLPDASAEDIRLAYRAKARWLEPARVSGAPSQAVAAITRAQALIDQAWQVLGDPAARRRYDEEALIRPAGPDPRAARRPVVPDFRGLPVRLCLHGAAQAGLHVRVVRLTEDPMPVEGLVVDHDPPPGARVRRSRTLTV